MRHQKTIVLELFTGLHWKVGHGLFQTHVFQVIFVVKLEANLKLRVGIVVGHWLSFASLVKFCLIS